VRSGSSDRHALAGKSSSAPEREWRLASRKAACV